MAEEFTVDWENGQKTTCQEISRKQIGIYWEVTVRCADGTTRKARSANVNQSKQLACMKCDESFAELEMELDDSEQPSVNAITVLTYNGLPKTDDSAKTVWRTFCLHENKTIYKGSDYDTAYNVGINHSRNTAHAFKIVSG